MARKAKVKIGGLPVDFDGIQRPEFFFGLVAPIGTDLDHISSCLSAELEKVAYRSIEIKVSKLLHEFDAYKDLAKIQKEEERYSKHMEAGTAVCERFQTGDALAQIAVLRIRIERERLLKGSREHGRAYILNSLKRPDEVEFLRKVYGQAFILIGVNSHRDRRIERLLGKISASENQSNNANFRSAAEKLVTIDESEDEKAFGQNVRGTFPKADFFVRADHRDLASEKIGRFIRIIFDSPVESPTSAEVSMFQAKAASLRSADLSRQVGAAVVDERHQLISVGCNEVPAAGGGQYWPGEGDGRDLALGYDSNAKYRDELLTEILGRLQDAGWLKTQKARLSRQNLLFEALKKSGNPPLKGSRAESVIEFGRIVHAEMAALMDALRHGKSVDRATLYCTTFPCHMCARHIVAAGIRKVFYIEPYPKSLASDLYNDSIAVDSQSHEEKLVHFAPFEGIAPRRFLDWFEKARRKDKDGRALTWSETKARPKLRRIISTYRFVEDSVTIRVAKMLTDLGISTARKSRSGRKRGRK